MSAEENKAVIRRWIEAYNERDLETEANILAPDYVAHVPAAPGPLEGLEAWRQFSGSFAEVTSIEVNRVRDGKVEEHWVELDLLGLMQQLGAIPESGHEEEEEASPT